MLDPHGVYEALHRSPRRINRRIIAGAAFSHTLDP
jgi:hypothetical protein